MCIKAIIINSLELKVLSISEITEMLPGILNQLGAESLTHLKRLATMQSTTGNLRIF